MSLRPERHPDMNLNDVDYSITYQLSQNFDVDRSWEQLAGVIGYSTTAILTFELEQRRQCGSPTKKLLWDWGSRGGTVRDLYGKLALINRTQSMRLLEHIMLKEKEVAQKGKPVAAPGDCAESPGSSPGLEGKSTDNSNMLNLSPDPATMSYNPSALPIPVLNKSGRTPSETPGTEDFNLNTCCSAADKNTDKQFKNVLIPEQGAASVEMTRCQADGPASSKGNMGAASSSVGSLQRVKSVVEEFEGSGDPGSRGCLSGLTANEAAIARALISTPHYTYKELSQATGGFSVDNRLGQGKFGAVYLGMVKNTKCAIKKLLQKHDKRGEENSSAHMASELKALCRYRHENIVTLYGYALDGDEVCLVYQYMPNRSLQDCLHCKASQMAVLSWDQRLSILLGAARGLQFLHTVDEKPVIHGDIKSANILLDRHFEAKVGDLGLAQQATGGATTGKLTHITRKNTSVHDYKNKAYQAPEIMRGSGFSIKGDTFAFGVVVYECLSGKEAFDERREGSSDDKYLMNYISNTVCDCPKLNKQETFQDGRLEKKPYPECIWEQMFSLADACTQDKKKDRPTMVEVYRKLEDTEKAYSGPEYHNLQEMNLDKLPVKSPPPDAGKNFSMTAMNGVSFDSNESYPAANKSANPVPPPQPAQDTSHTSKSTHAPRPEPLASPIDCLPKNQPIPEAFRLQLEMDQKKDHVGPDSHKYENVSCKLVKQMKNIYVSDPKKLAEIEAADREFNAPQTDTGKPQSEHPSSDFEKVKAIEEFDRRNLGERRSPASEPVESEYASDPKKLALIEGQDEVLRNPGSVESHVYENAPPPLPKKLPHEGHPVGPPPAKVSAPPPAQFSAPLPAQMNQPVVPPPDQVFASPPAQMYQYQHVPVDHMSLQTRDLPEHAGTLQKSYPSEHAATEYQIYDPPTQLDTEQAMYPPDGRSQGAGIDTEEAGLSSQATGQSQYDVEFDDITGKAMKGNSSMMDVFNKFDVMKQDEQYQFEATDDVDDDFPEFDFGNDDSGSSTITESINNDFDSFHLSQISENDLFDQESPVAENDSQMACDDNQGMCNGNKVACSEKEYVCNDSQAVCNETGQACSDVGQSPSHKTRTVSQHLKDHQQKLAKYTELTGYSAAIPGEHNLAGETVNQSKQDGCQTGYSAAPPGEYTPADETVNQSTGSLHSYVNVSPPRSREPTEN